VACDRSKERMAKRFSWFQSFTVQFAEAEMKIFSWNLQRNELHRFEGVNPLFLWPFSIAM
jgi:hypothetical protein